MSRLCQVRKAGLLFFMEAVLVFQVFCLASSVQIPSGSFAMGSTNGEVDEQPVHRVELDNFTIDKKEVTVASYNACVERGACTPAHYSDGTCLIWNGRQFQRVVVPPQFRQDTFPVVCVTWQQARQYCRSQGKDLPTEAQWEYAGRCGNNRPYSWGHEPPSPTRCAFHALTHPRPVATYPPNDWGMYDMTGNVWEWVSDRYQRDYYQEPNKKKPTGPVVGRYRVIRGGGWYSRASQLRTTNRHWFSPTSAEVSIGFRCAGKP